MSGAAGSWSEALAARPRAPGPEWLLALRERAAERFQEHGLPHRKVEAWKYTPLQLLDGLAPLAGGAEQAPAADVPEPLDERALRVVMGPGGPVGRLPQLPAGVTLLPLAEGLERYGERLRPLYESLALDGRTHAFAALNTACAGHGLVLQVAAGADAGPLEILWTFGSGAALAHARLFLLLDDGARLALRECFGGTADAAGALNLVTQAELGDGARFGHLRLQAGPAAAMLLTATSVEQAAGSRYGYTGFDLGARLARHELTVRLAGPEAAAELSGAWLLDGQRYADHHVSVDHAAPGCRSEQFFRGVLGGRSRGVYNGRALIRPGADGSSVRQSNANLLLSPLAEIDTKPELEIYADEVEASHGATVGQLDEGAVFYLRSRGLTEADARRMLTAAHCRAVTDRLEDRGLAEKLNALLEAAMPGARSE